MCKFCKPEDHCTYEGNRPPVTLADLSVDADKAAVNRPKYRNLKTDGACDGCYEYCAECRDFDITNMVSITENSEAMLAYAVIYQDYLEAIENKGTWKDKDEVTYRIFNNQAFVLKRTLRILEAAFKAFPWRNHHK